MLTGFEWFSMLTILASTYAGGFLPLFWPERARDVGGFPMGQAFAAGVFLALSLTMMLPSATHLFKHAYPELDYPVAAFVGIVAFLLLLLLEHGVRHMQHTRAPARNGRPPPIIPIIMTAMIAIPSFFLGTALGISETASAVFILIAILAHKSSAGFALALKMMRSALSRKRVLLLFTGFALATPFGIIVGEQIHALLGAHVMVVVKGFVLAVAAGVFLYMSTLHELEGTPLIVDCRNRKGFFFTVLGFLLTAMVRLLIGEAHRVAG